jgi:hypothetical protein
MVNTRRRKEKARGAGSSTSRKDNGRIKQETRRLFFEVLRKGFVFFFDYIRYINIPDLKYTVQGFECVATVNRVSRVLIQEHKDIVIVMERDRLDITLSNMSMEFDKVGITYKKNKPLLDVFMRVVGIHCKLRFQLKRNQDNKVFVLLAGDEVDIRDIEIKVSETIFSKFYEVGWEYVKKNMIDTMKIVMKEQMEKAMIPKIRQMNSTMILSDTILRRIFDLQESRDLQEATVEEITTGVITGTQLLWKEGKKKKD